MKNLIKIIAVSILLQSCGPRLIHLKNDYSKVQNTFYTDLNKEKTWENIVKLFSTNGIGIQLIDKSSGLIASNKTDFKGTFTVEDKNGNLINNDAFIVTEKINGGLMGDWTATHVYGSWNIRLFEENGKTGVNINVVNLDVYHFFSRTSYSAETKFELGAKSTGNFEKLIMEKIAF